MDLEGTIFIHSSWGLQLQLVDDGGIDDLPIVEIYSGMDNLGYVTEGKLTFFKNKFSPQWRFLVHTLLHCLSTKSGSWDQFGSSIAVALICLSDGRRFNWSSYIFKGMVSNIGNAKKFLMYPRFLQTILGIKTSITRQYHVFKLSSKLFANMKLNFVGQTMPLLDAMLSQAQEGEGAGADVQAVPPPISETIPETRHESDHSQDHVPTPTRPQATPNVTPIFEKDQQTEPNIASSSRIHETEDDSLGGSFHVSPPRFTQASPTGHASGGAEDHITLSALSSAVSTLVQKVHSLETELKAHKKLFKDVVPKLVKKVKALEVQLKTKKRKVVLSDSDQEDGGEPDVDLDALNALANAAVTVDSTKSTGGHSKNPAACSYDSTEFSTDVPTTEVPSTEFPTEVPSGVAPTGPSTVSPGSTTVPTSSSVPAAETIPASSGTTTATPSSPVRDARKGKGVDVEEPSATQDKTFKQLEKERLGWEAAQRLQAQELADFEKQRAESLMKDANLARQMSQDFEMTEAQRKRQQEVLASAANYSDASWDIILARLQTNPDLSSTIFGVEFSDDDFATRMVALVNSRRRELAEQRAQERRDRPMTPSQLMQYIRTYLQEEFDKIRRAVAFTRGLKRDGSLMTSASSKKLKNGDVEVNVEAPYHGVPQEEEGATPSQNVSREEVASPSHSQDILEAQVEVPSQEATIEDVEVPSNIASTTQHTASSLQKVGTKKKRLGRKGVHTSQSTIPIEEGDPEAKHKVCIKYASDADSASDDDTPVNLYVVVDWELLPTGLGSINAIYRLDNSRKYFTSLREILHLVTRADLMTIYGRVMTFYQDKKAAGVGLVLWGDLKVLMDSPEVNDGSDVWKNQHTWSIQSWKLYSFSGVHVLETVSGLVIHMFVDKKYPLSVNLIERMLDHQLEICHDTVGNELTTAVQLIAFLKKQISDSKRPKVHDCPRVNGYLVKASSNSLLFFDSPLPGVNTPWDVMRIVSSSASIGIVFLLLLIVALAAAHCQVSILKLTSADLSRNLKYVVPTGRVKVPAGRYVVPTGKDNVIVSAGRTKVIPAGRTILVLEVIILISLASLRIMDITKAEQIALDDALVAPANRLKIGKCNLRLSSDLTSKEATLQVVYDVLKLTPFYKAFQASADVPEIYMQEFWATASVHNRSIRFKMNNKKHIVNLEYFREMLQICPIIRNQKFDEPPFEQEILTFLVSLGHSGEIRKITDVNVNKLHQPWRSFAAVINKCLSGKSSYDSLRLSQAQIIWGMYHKKNVDYAFLLWEDFTYQVENKNTKKGNVMYYPRFTKLIVNFFMSKDPSIPRRNKINWHYARDDPMFTTINVISRHEDTQLYGAILPKELTNEDIRNSESYKEYYAIASGEVPPKTKASVHKKKADSDTTPKEKPPTDPKDKRVKQTGKMTGSGKQKQPATGLETLSEIALTETEQLKIAIKRSRIQTHNSQASGSGDGVDILSKVPDEQVHEKTGTDEGAGDKPEVPDVPEHHSNSEEESWTFSDDDDDEDDDANKDSDAHDDDDDDATESDDDGDNITHPKLSTFSTDDQEEQDDEEEQEEDDEDEEEISDQLVRTPSDYQTTDESEKQKDDDKVKDGEEDKEGDVTNVNLEGGDVDMTKDDTTKDTEDAHVTLTAATPVVQQQSSSVLDLVSKFISPTTDEGIDFILTPHTESTTLVNVPISVATATPATTTTIPPPLFTVTQSSQQTPVTITTTTNPSTTPLPLPNFGSVFGFNQRVITCSKNLYNALVEAYNTDKDLLSSYGDVLIIPITRDDKDKDEEPSAGSNRGTKRWRSGKEDESSKEPTRKESRTTSSSKGASKSQPTNLNETTHLEFITSDDDVIPAREVQDERQWHPPTSPTPDHEWHLTKTISDLPP
ncbi:hypothetical protein Tco_0397196 [Tanacetum coccineum]